MKLELILALALISVFVIDYLIKKKKSKLVNEIDVKDPKYSSPKSLNVNKSFMILMLVLIPIQTYINIGLSTYFDYSYNGDQQELLDLVSPYTVYSGIVEDPSIIWSSFIGANGQSYPNAFDEYNFNINGVKYKIPTYLNFLYLFLILLYFLFGSYTALKKYLIIRKKNFAVFLLLIPVLKVLIHYFFYPITTGGRIALGAISPRARFGQHIDVIFTDELLLFIPAIVLISLVVWLFNDKIKAR